MSPGNHIRADATISRRSLPIQQTEPSNPTAYLPCCDLPICLWNPQVFVAGLDIWDVPIWPTPLFLALLSSMVTIQPHIPILKTVSLGYVCSWHIAMPSM